MQPGTDQAACSPVESIKPLQGFKVVELHAIGPVPFAGYILAQLGAQVIRVSPPSDPQQGVGVSARFDLLNSNKSAHALDLKSRQGLDALDVLLEDVKNLGYKGTGRKYGVSDNAIRKWLK